MILKCRGWFGHQEVTAVFCWLATVPLLSSQVLAEGLRVPEDYASIQAAVTAAVNGDSILVSPGVYNEQIDLDNKQVDIISTDGPLMTIIDGSGLNGYLVRITGSTSSGSAFSGFTVRNGNGGMRVHEADPLITNCVFQSNSISNNYGGGLAIFNASPLVSSCTFLDNFAIIGGGIYTEFSNSQIVDCIFTENRGGYGAGAGFVAGAVKVEGAVFEENSANSFAGGAYFNYGSPTVLRSHFTGNSSLGGGAVYSSNAALRLQNSRIRGNNSFAGGGVYVAGGNVATLVNCLIDGNNSSQGGGVYLNSASPEIVNCTIAGNQFGGIFTTFNSFPEVANSIIANNGNDDIWIGVEVYGNGKTKLSYSLVGGALLAGFENGEGVQSQVRPGFADADFRLGAESPAIDAGNNFLVPEGVSEDLAGNPRFVDDPSTPATGIGKGPIVDLGAYEFQPIRTDDRPVEKSARRRLSR